MSESSRGRSNDIVLTVLDADEVAGSAKLGTRAPCVVALQPQEAHRRDSDRSAEVSPRRPYVRDPAMGWLVLERSVGEHLRIGHDIRLTVVGFDRAGAVRLGTEAPPAVAVHREEIYAKVQQQKAAAVVQRPATEPQVVYRRRRVPTV